MKSNESQLSDLPVESVTLEEESNAPTPVDEQESPLEQYSEESNQNEGDDERGTRWKEGDDITFVRVRFPGNSRSFAFLQGKRTYAYGQKVVAMSDRGMDVGYINSFPYTVKFKKDMLPIRSISKGAELEDIEAMRGNIDEQKRAERKAVTIIEKLGLDMQITHVEIIQFGKKMVFYFTAPSRVDFRELVKQLVGELKMRIELRQISVRDRAAALGSIGSCGLATCCSTFLKNYGNVTIKMAKNQNLALIPSKINGVCGQIKCCIKYEDNVYTDKRKTLPKEGVFLKAKNGDIGKVTKLHILVEQFDMITEKGQIRRYARNQFSNGKPLGKDYKFPESFKHVVNETSTVIGLSEVEAEMSGQFLGGMSDDEKAMANIKAIKNDDHIIKREDSNSEGNEQEVDPIDSSDDQDSTHPDRDDQEKKTQRRSNSRNSNNRRGNRNSKNRGRSNQAEGPKGEEKSEGNSDTQKKSRNNKRRRRRPHNKKPNGEGGQGGNSRPSSDS